jgi:hypothetical protein
MRTVRKYRGVQRQKIRAAIKICQELQADAIKHAGNPIGNNTVITSYVTPLLAAMEADLSATITR